MRVSLTGLLPRSYILNVYQVGYGVNDVYTDYFKRGSPLTLTREQVRLLAERNNGRPVSTERVRVGQSGKFVRSFQVRENDVYLLTLLPVDTKSKHQRSLANHSLPETSHFVSCRCGRRERVSAEQNTREYVPPLSTPPFDGLVPPCHCV